MNEIEYDWRAEDDARTLARSAEIKMDGERALKAKKCLERNIKDSRKALRELRNLPNVPENASTKSGRGFPNGAVLGNLQAMRDR